MIQSVPNDLLEKVLKKLKPDYEIFNYPIWKYSEGIWDPVRSKFARMNLAFESKVSTIFIGITTVNWKIWIKMHWKQQGSYLLWNQMVPKSPRLDWNRLHRCWWPNQLLTTLGCWWRHLSLSDRCLAPKSIREIGHWHSIFWVVTNISNVTDIDWSTTCP